MGDHRSARLRIPCTDVKARLKLYDLHRISDTALHAYIRKIKYTEEAHVLLD
jgi:hypothetical protein